VILLPPAMESSFADAEFASHLRDLRSTGQLALCLAQLADDLSLRTLIVTGPNSGGRVTGPSRVRWSCRAPRTKRTRTPSTPRAAGCSRAPTGTVVGTSRRRSSRHRLGGGAHSEQPADGLRGRARVNHSDCVPQRRRRRELAGTQLA
jgi:hypothetical protein